MPIIISYYSMYLEGSIESHQLCLRRISMQKEDRFNRFIPEWGKGHLSAKFHFFVQYPPPPQPPHTHRYKFKIKMNFCNGKLEHFYAIVFNIFSITIKLKVTCSCIPNYIPHASEIIFYKTVLFLVLRSSTSYVSKIIQLLKIHWKYYTLLSLTVDRSKNSVLQKNHCFTDHDLILTQETLWQ